MADAPFTLKRGRDECDSGRCAASRCAEASDVVDASKKVWAALVPLCSRHWELRCNWEEDDASDNERQDD
jgi:hypothetical protein